MPKPLPISVFHKEINAQPYLHIPFIEVDDNDETLLSDYYWHEPAKHLFKYTICSSPHDFEKFTLIAKIYNLTIKDIMSISRTDPLRTNDFIEQYCCYYTEMVDMNDLHLAGGKIVYLSKSDSSVPFRQSKLFDA